MKPSQTIFNKTEGTVTIRIERYNELLEKSNKCDEYKSICEEFRAVLQGDAE